jgi:hypothetical protein
VVTDPQASLLQINTPTGLERFFVEMGEKAQALTLPPPGLSDVEKLMALAPKYHI